MLMKERLLSMLVLLAAVVTGAWADDETVTYALKTSDSFASGQTVEVKNAANDVVATITYGESGGADFNSPKNDNNVEGFSAFTDGNGVNGNKTGGTFYTITPKVNATITVAVVLNAGKAFYILEDGTALATTTASPSARSTMAPTSLTPRPTRLTSSIARARNSASMASR